MVKIYKKGFFIHENFFHELKNPFYRQLYNPVSSSPARALFYSVSVLFFTHAQTLMRSQDDLIIILSFFFLPCQRLPLPEVLQPHNL